MIRVNADSGLPSPSAAAAKPAATGLLPPGGHYPVRTVVNYPGETLPTLVGPPILAVGSGGPDTRAANLTLVLQSLYRQPGLTRAELARRTGLARVTISDLVAQLIGDGLLRETGLADQARAGRKAISLAVRDDTTDIIALDLSGSEQILGAVFSLYGELRYEQSAPIDGATGESAVALGIGLIEDLTAHCRNRLLGIGVGMPGTIDQNGRVLTALALGWHDFDLQDRLAQRFHCLAGVINDGNAGVLAEQMFVGGTENLLRVQLTRGVGAGLMLDGQVVIGQSAAAGEIGHLVVEHNGTRCLCGKRGCLETWASVPALQRRIVENPARRDEILAEGGRRLGMVLAPILAMLDIDDIVLGGPDDLILGPFIDAAEALVNERLQSEFRGPVHLRTSALDGNATLLGAVALILRTSLGLR